MRKLSLFVGSAVLAGTCLFGGAAANASIQDAFPGCAPVIGDDSVRVTIQNATCGRTIRVSVIWYHRFTGATWPSTCYPIAPRAAQSYLYPSNVYEFRYFQSEHLCS